MSLGGAALVAKSSLSISAEQIAIVARNVDGSGDVDVHRKVARPVSRDGGGVVLSVVERVDIDQLMSETELGTIIAQSTSGVASQALDTVRSQGVGLDGFIAKWANRLTRRDPAELPAGPPLLVDQPRALPPAESS